jgi:uncharacterized membrane protein YecN with MAPEG domain
MRMITGLYAGLCGVLLLVLSVRVSQRRLATKVGIGTGGDGELERRIRAHANLVENAPLALLLLFFIEQSGVAAAYIHAAGAAFVIARVLHARGLSMSSERSASRFYGSLGTLVVLIGLSLGSIVAAVSAIL